MAAQMGVNLIPATIAAGQSLSPQIDLGVLTLAGTLAYSSGGTGLTATPTNGQLLIGNGAGYSLSTLTAGSGVTITNSAGVITITIDNSGSTASATGGAGIGGTSVPVVGVTGTTKFNVVVLNEASVG